MRHRFVENIKHWNTALSAQPANPTSQQKVFAVQGDIFGTPESNDVIQFKSTMALIKHEKILFLIAEYNFDILHT
jgi:hypothetical protein